MRAAPPTPASQCLSAHARACSRRLDFDALYAYLSTSNYDFNYGDAHRLPTTAPLPPSTPCLNARSPGALRPRKELAPKAQH